MPYSDFIRSLKAMTMLQAQEGIANIQQSNFHSFEQRDRDKIIRSLKEYSEKYISRPVLDYKDVVANFARKLKGG